MCAITVVNVPEELRVLDRRTKESRLGAHTAGGENYGGEEGSVTGARGVGVGGAVLGFFLFFVGFVC